MAIMIPRDGEFIDRVCVNEGEWRCEESGCQFVRHYATKMGAMVGASNHMWQQHQKVLRLPTSNTGFTHEKGATFVLKGGR